MQASLQNQKGFTLIELLVVIAIIGLLSSVVLASMNTARIKARDARRKADLKQIQIALQLYFDAYGQYPPAKLASTYCGATFVNGDWASSNGTCGNKWLTTDDNFYQFMSSVPVDPINTGAIGATTSDNWVYSYRTNIPGNGPNNTDYNLLARLENPSDQDRCEVRMTVRHLSTDDNKPWCPPWPNYLNAINLNVYADH